MRSGRTLRLSCLMLLLMCLQACADRPPPNARGAGSLDELLEAYRQAHSQQDITLLHDYVLWRAPNWGMRGWREREEGIVRLFALELNEITYAEITKPSYDGQTQYEYSGIMPDGREVPVRGTVIGFVVGRALLEGYTTDGTKLRVDPVMAVRPYRGRFYFATSHPILGDAAEAIEQNRPQTSEVHPIEGEVFHVWWTAEEGQVTELPPPSEEIMQWGRAER